MSALDDAVAAFGRGMALGGLAVPQDGALRLAFERRGTLLLERAGDDLLLYLVRPYPYAGADLLADLLDLCHWRHDRTFQVQPGMREDDILLLIRLGGRDLTQARIEQAFTLLSQLHDRLSP